MHPTAFSVVQPFELQLCQGDSSTESPAFESRLIGKRETGEVKGAASSLDSLTKCFRAKLSLEAVDASSAPSPSACAASLTSPSDAVLVAELERLVQPLGPLLLEALKTPLKLALPWRCSASACSVFEEAKQPALPTGEVDVHQRLLDGVRGIRLLLSAAGAIPVAACREARALPLLVAALSVPSKALMFEAAWCLTNVASGSSGDAADLVEMGTLLFLFGNLFAFHPDALGRPCGAISGSTPNSRRGSSPVTEEEVLEQVLWALANLSGDNAAYRDMLLQPERLFQHAERLLQEQRLPGPLHSLLERRLHELARVTTGCQRGGRSLGASREEDPSSLRLASSSLEAVASLPRLPELLSALRPDLWSTQTWRTSAWLLSNLCRGSPKPKLEVVKEVLPLLSQALSQQLARPSSAPSVSSRAAPPCVSEDSEVAADACWAVDGVASQVGGVQILLAERQLLRQVVHVLVHNCAVCCCARDNSRRGDGMEARPSASSARLCETTQTNPCCRVCCSPRSAQSANSRNGDCRQLPLRPALRIVGQVAAGTPRQAQALLDCCTCVSCHDAPAGVWQKRGCLRDGPPPALRALRALLEQDRGGLCKDACWCVSNLAVGSRSQLRLLKDSGVLQESLRLLQRSPSQEVRREALWVAVNACITASTYEELLLLLTHGAFEQLWTMLEQQCSVGDEKGVESAMEAIANVLTLAEAAQEEQSQRRSRVARGGLGPELLSAKSLSGEEKLAPVSCGCCRGVSFSESLSSCQCPCHEPLLLLSKITPQSEALLLLKQVQEQQLSPILDQKSQVLANALLRLMERAPTQHHQISFT